MAAKSIKGKKVTPNAEDEEKKSTAKVSSKAKKTDDDDDDDDLEEETKPVKKSKTSAKKSKGDDEEEEDTDVEVEDDWEKTEEDDEWDPDFAEFDVPKSKVKKPVGKKSAKDDDDDFKIDDDFKDLGFDDLGWGQDRYVAARHELALLGDCGITDKREQVGLNTCVIEKGVALRCRAIRGHFLAGAFLFNQENQEIVLDPLGLRLKVLIFATCLQAAQPFLY